MQLLIETALASWRLAYMLVHEDGPYAIFARLRYRAGLQYVPVKDGNGDLAPAAVAMTTWAEGLTCVRCVSVWVAALFMLTSELQPSRLIRRMLAASALAIAIHEVIECLRSRN